MAKRGEGYGSEDHLHRYWTDQRPVLEKGLLQVLDRSRGSLEWIYPSTVDKSAREPEGLGFLPPDSPALANWKEFWPQSGSQQCWDGVATLAADAGIEWLLVEAKANHAEFCTPPCGAAKHGGRAQIERALSVAKRHLEVHRDFGWLGSYYQHANRLATLYFLSTQGIRAHLVEILFVGDSFPDHRRCPQDETEWRDLLRARQLTLGLPDRHLLSDQVHELFLPAIRKSIRTTASS
jgi:hypothetical protein